jgi:hypothetical protein
MEKDGRILTVVVKPEKERDSTCMLAWLFYLFGLKLFQEMDWALLGQSVMVSCFLTQLGII